MISIDVMTPLPAESSIGSGFITSLQEDVSSYSHEVGTDGGFRAASIDISSNRNEAADWLQNGIGRHIVVKFAGVVAWEGFVDQITVSSGRSSVVKGPLLDAINKARVTWNKHTFGGLVPGGQRITDFASDETAQEEFFILEGDISGGTLVSATEAEAIRDLYLEENSRPKTKSDVSDSGQSTSISLECAGYYRLLERYYYLRAVEADIEATEKIKDVLDADPNGIFDSTHGRFDDIGITVNEYEDWSRTASSIIFELVSLGNSSNERMSFGVYRDRFVTLEAASDEITYEISEGFNGSILSMRSGGPIPPALVRPGNWMRVNNYPVSRGKAGTRASESDIFVETVVYQAPDQLSINGGQFDTFAQRLARFNFGLV